MNRRFASLLIAAAAPVLLAAPAAAPAARGACPASGLKGHNSNAPVDWSADQIEVQDQIGRVFLTGNVVAKQTDLTLTAARITAAYSKRGGTHVDRLDANGGVTVHSPAETAKGDFGIYDLNKKLITLVGNVRLVRCDSNVRGGRLVYDLSNGRAVMDGAGGGSGGRVSGTFSVPKKQD